MPTENKIDCPALHKRSASYPYGDRVPRTVRMLVTATADRIPGVELSHSPEAKAGQTYRVWTNSHGAVVAVMDDGNRLGLRPAEFEVDSWHYLAAEPAPQPHGEPIAWMVGTAFWWTKEEAERDAAATGLPIVGLGPLYSGQVQGEPVAWRYRHAKPGMSWFFTESPDASGCLVDGFEYEVSPLYVRADPGEVERLRQGIAKHWKVVCDQRAEIESLRDQLIKVVRSGALTAPEHEALEAECCALSATAEPSAPVAQA